MQADLLRPAFNSPVDESQRVFRVALKALSEPGTVQKTVDLPPLDTLDPATYAMCLTLADETTPVWLAPSLDTPAVRTNLAFHCACPIAERPEDAELAVLAAGDLDTRREFDVGSDRDPHLSCTLLVQLASLEGGAPAAWQGPGIAHRRIVRIPVPALLWQQREAQRFPRGFDVFFTAGDSLLGLPRSTRILHSVQEQG